jgi:hypothetical protein
MRSRYKTPKNALIIDEKRWFQKTYGNTYHSVTVTADGKTEKSGIHYGYGDQYQQTAFDLLQKMGYFEGATYSDFLKFLYEPPGKVTIYRTVADVPRERDLK